VTLVCRQQ